MASFFMKKRFWGALIAVAILIFLFYDLDIPRTVEIARRLKVWYLIPALICSTFLVIFKTLRWRTIVSRIRRVLIWPTLCLYATSQMVGVLLPALTGQAGRIILFSKKGNFTKTFAFSTIFLEVALDGAGLLILMLLSSTVFVFPSQYRSISYVIAVATIIFFAVFYASLQYQGALERFGHDRIRRRWPRVYLILRKFLRSFNDGISIMKSADKITVTAAYTFLAWLMHVAAIYFLFKMFGLGLPAWAAVIIIIINYLALMVPITPGNLGSFQLAVVGGLNLFAVDKTVAVLFSVMLYAVDMLPMIALSICFLLKEHFSISEISEDEQLIEEVGKMVVESDVPVGDDKP
jgi:uncharacterized protein (TIRG00374 family)